MFNATQQMREKYVKKWQPLLEGISDPVIKSNVAVLLENEAKYLLEAEGKTSTGDVAGLQKIMLPIVRRVFPNLVANNLVSVQPISGPVGIIFYLKYVYGTERPGTSVGDEFSMYQDTAGAVEGYNPYYSSDEIGPFTKTGDLSADGTTTVITTDAPAGGITTKWPVIANSWFGTIETADAVYSFAYEGSAYVVREANMLKTTTAFTVTESGNQITVAANGTAYTDVKVTAFYKTDLEFTENIPEMKITIGNIPVTTKTRKLKAMWSQESEQDLKAYHGLNADAELTALISNEMISEIDREIISKIMSIVPRTSRLTYDYAAFATNNTSGNYLDAHLAMMQKVTTLSNEIFRKSKMGPANWLICGTKVSSYIETLKNFVPNPAAQSFGMNIVKAGTYNGKFDIYKDPLFPDNKILLGHKSPVSPFGAGVVYAPYVTNLTPVIVGENDFNPRRGFLARYGLTQVPHGENLYGLITVNNLH